MNPPTTMKLEGDVAANWTEWKSEFDKFLKTNNIPSTSDKAPILLHLCIGEDALKLYRTFDIDEAQAGDLNAILKKFDAHFNSTLTQRRVDFVHCKQASGQSAEEFIEAATKQARQCRWGELEEELVRLIVINGCSDKVAKRHLLAQGKGRSLAEAVVFLKAADEVRKMYSDDVQEGDGAKPKQTRPKRSDKKDTQPPAYSSPDEQPPPYSPLNKRIVQPHNPPSNPNVPQFSLSSKPTEQPYIPPHKRIVPQNLSSNSKVEPFSSPKSHSPPSQPMVEPNNSPNVFSENKGSLLLDKPTVQPNIPILENKASLWRDDPYIPPRKRIGKPRNLSSNLKVEPFSPPSIPIVQSHSPPSKPMVQPNILPKMISENKSSRLPDNQPTPPPYSPPVKPTVQPFNPPINPKVPPFSPPSKPAVPPNSLSSKATVQPNIPIFESRGSLLQENPYIPPHKRIVPQNLSSNSKVEPFSPPKSHSPPSKPMVEPNNSPKVLSEDKGSLLLDKPTVQPNIPIFESKASLLRENPYTPPSKRIVKPQNLSNNLKVEPFSPPSIPIVQSHSPPSKPIVQPNILPKMISENKSSRLPDNQPTPPRYRPLNELIEQPSKPIMKPYVSPSKPSVQPNIPVLDESKTSLMRGNPPTPRSYIPPSKRTVQPYNPSSDPKVEPPSKPTVQSNISPKTLDKSKASPMQGNQPTPSRYIGVASPSKEFVYVSMSTPSLQTRRIEQTRERKKKDTDCVIV